MLGNFRNNLVYRLISIFAAVIIWSFIFAGENPLVEDIVTVPLEPRYLAGNMVVADIQSNVNIHFQGNANVMDRVSSRDFRAYVILDDVNVGSNSVRVNVVPPAGVRVISIRPSWIPVYIDQVSFRQEPVEIVVNGEVATGYVLGNPLINPNQVLITGPGNFLESIHRVYVNATFDNLSEDYSQSLPVLVEDRYGNLIVEWVNVTPETVSVLIPVIEDMPTRTVPVLINLTGDLRPGLEMERVLVYPATVKIYGPKNVIDETGFLTLEIDITEIQESTDFEVTLELPQGITHVSNERVRVILEVN